MISVGMRKTEAFTFASLDEGLKQRLRLIESAEKERVVCKDAAVS